MYALHLSPQLLDWIEPRFLRCVRHPTLAVDAVRTDFKPGDRCCNATTGSLADPESPQLCEGVLGATAMFTCR